MRYSVAPKVATRIQDLYPEAVIKYHDSVVNSEVDKYDILKDSDLLLILTEHQEYKELNEKSFMVKAANSMRVPRIFDGKNILCQSATFDASPAVAIRGIGYSEAKG
jgi:UDP-N-acetyl-D-mannosaminuronate dehydrogenase